MPALMSKFAMNFTDTDTVTITGDQHGLLTPDLGVVVYEITGMIRRSIQCQYVIHSLTMDIVITLGQSISGRVVIF